MSIEAMTVVLHHAPVKGTDKLVLLGIANHEGDGGAWPALSTLAKYANVDERTVRRSLRKLEDDGLVSVEQQQGGTQHTRNDRRPNRYRVLVECPPECDRSMHHRVDGGTPMPPRGRNGGTWASQRGDVGVTHGGTPVSPEPSFESSVEPELMNPSASEGLLPPDGGEGHEAVILHFPLPASAVPGTLPAVATVIGEDPEETAERDREKRIEARGKRLRRSPKAGFNAFNLALVFEDDLVLAVEVHRKRRIIPPATAVNVGATARHFKEWRDVGGLTESEITAMYKWFIEELVTGKIRLGGAAPWQYFVSHSPKYRKKALQEVARFASKSRHPSNTPLTGF